MSDLELWYDAPRSNGPRRCRSATAGSGAMVFGGIGRERLQLNEDTLWTGGPYSPVNPEAQMNLQAVRSLILVVVEALAIDLDRHELADEIVARLGATLCDLFGEVVAELLEHAPSTGVQSRKMLSRSIDHRWNRSVSCSGSPRISAITRTGKANVNRRTRSTLPSATKKESMSSSTTRRTSVCSQRASDLGRNAGTTRVRWARWSGSVHRDHRAREHRAHDLAHQLRREHLAVTQHGERLVVPEHAEVQAHRPVGSRRGATASQ